MLYPVLAVAVVWGWWLWLSSSEQKAAYDPDYPIGVATGTLVVVEDVIAQRLAQTPTAPALLPGLLSDTLPVTLLSTDDKSNSLVVTHTEPAPTRTAFWATDYVTKSALLTAWWEGENGDVFTATSPPYVWIATQGAIIVVVTSPPEIYITEVYVNVPEPYPVVVTAAPTRTPVPSAVPTASYTPTLDTSPTATVTPSASATPVSEVTIEVTESVELTPDM